MKPILFFVLLLGIVGCSPRPAPVITYGIFVPKGHVALRVAAVDREARIEGADVFLDGVALGTTRFDGAIQMGTHEITVRAPDGRVASWSGDVTTAMAIRLDLAAREEPAERGSLDPAIIDATIKRRLALIQGCYERELARRPSIHGKIVVNFAFLANGSVEYVRIKSSTMDDHAVEACVTREFLEIRFDAEPDRGRITVNYPLLFKTS